VYYKANLNTTLSGYTRDLALKPKLYAIYNSNSDGTGGAAADKKIELNVSLQDCACCGAKTGNNGWLNFMCHNLGANENLNPFEWVTGNADGSGGTLGHLYQWGRYHDGHEVRNKAHATSGHPTVAQYNTAVSNFKSSGTPINYNQFYTRYNTNYYDWVSDTPDNDASNYRWGSSTDNNTSTTPKGPNDPCPAGWKVPSYRQWRSIFFTDPASVDDGVGYPYGSATANTWTRTGTWDTSGGYMVGDALYLPAAGCRYYDGVLSNVGGGGYYWSSTWYSKNQSYNLTFYSSEVYPGYVNSRVFGFSVRCVSE
jgi:uncharacterized protein (TIGR02145 family)